MYFREIVHFSPYFTTFYGVNLPTPLPVMGTAPSGWTGPQGGIRGGHFGMGCAFQASFRTHGLLGMVYQCICIYTYIYIYVPWSKVAILRMVIPPLIGILIMGI